MTSLEKDKAYLEAGVSELEDYLLSNELFWPVTTRGFDLPRLTIGGLLLAKARLKARGAQIEALLSQLEAVRSKWRVAWETKAGRGFQSRFNLWSNYLSDYRHNPEGHADAYPHEARYRAMMKLLLAELPAPPAELAGLSQLDSLLRANFIPGDFIWGADLQSGFPEDEYWYLYGKLKT